MTGPREIWTGSYTGWKDFPPIDTSYILGSVWARETVAVKGELSHWNVQFDESWGSTNGQCYHDQNKFTHATTRTD